MRSKRSRYSTAFHFLLLVLCLGPLNAQQKIDSDCKKFQDLIRTRDIKLSTRPPHNPLLPKELLQPVIEVENLSGKYIDVPEFDKTSGVYMSLIEPGIGGPSTSTRKSNEVTFCSFPTLPLEPGGKRVFHLVRSTSDFFERDRAPLSETLWKVRPSAGKGSYRISLGSLQLVGTYEVSSATVEDYGCVKKEYDDVASINPELVDSSEPLCQAVVVAKMGEAFYLMAGATTIRETTFRNIVNAYLANGIGPLDEYLLAAASVRLFELSGPARIVQGHSLQAIERNDFQVNVLGVGSMSLSDIKARHEESKFIRR
jgi:hypothetical protein